MSSDIARIGVPVMGRQNYQLVDKKNKKYIIFSIPQKNVNRFEYLSDTYNAAAKKARKKYNFLVKTSTILGAIGGAIAPFAVSYLTKKPMSAAQLRHLSITGIGYGGAAGYILSVLAGYTNIIRPIKQQIPYYKREVAKMDSRIEKAGRY